MGLFVKDLYTHSFVVNRRFLAFCMLNVFVQLLFQRNGVLDFGLKMLDFILLIEDAALVECGLFVELPDLLFHGCNVS